MFCSATLAVTKAHPNLSKQQSVSTLVGDKSYLFIYLFLVWGYTRFSELPPGSSLKDLS